MNLAINIRSILASLGGMAVLVVVFGLFAGQGVLSNAAERTDATGEEQTAEPPTVGRPTPSQPAVGLDSDRHLDKTPPRHTKGLDLVKMGWTYNCMDCHKLLESRWHYDRPLTEHAEIKLQHGNNRFCLNCHHPSNRNAFVDYDGSEIAEENVVLLCAKCHGPTYQDWEAGVHGRRNGYWDAKKGAQTRLRCIQCHDPHHPQFKLITPLKALTYPKRAAGAHQINAKNHGDGELNSAGTSTTGNRHE